MIQAEPLDLKHQKAIRAHLQSLQLGLSEYTFANAYLFRSVHSYEVLQGEGLYLRGISRDGFRYIMPLQCLSKVPSQEMLEVISSVDGLFPIPNKWRYLFAPNSFEINSWEGDSDYVYTTEKLCHYPGRHLSGQRNFVKQFLKNYTSTSYPLTLERQGDAITVLDAWQAGLVDDKDTDYEACREALQLWGQLEGLEGEIYYADDRPVGFVIGEPLTPCVYVLHFLKARKEYKGIYSYLYQRYAHNLTGRFAYVNLEQDLGKPQLAQAKSAYVPDHRCQKLRVSLRKFLAYQVRSGRMPADFQWPPHEKALAEKCSPC